MADLAGLPITIQRITSYRPTLKLTNGINIYQLDASYTPISLYAPDYTETAIIILLCVDSTNTVEMRGSLTLRNGRLIAPAINGSPLTTITLTKGQAAILVPGGTWRTQTLDISTL